MKKVSKLLAKQSLTIITILLIAIFSSCAPSSTPSTITSTITVTSTPPAITVTSSVGVTTPAGATTTSSISEFEIIRAAAYEYANSGKVTEISAKDVQGNLKDNKPGNDALIISVRWSDSELYDIYLKGHIDTSINVPQDLVFKEEPIMVPRSGYTEENIPTSLSKMQQTVVCSYNGHVGDQVTALLNVLGYDAVNIKWGMTAWTKNVDVAPGRYDVSKDTEAYRIDNTSPYTTSEKHALPVVENTSSTDKHEIIRAAADAYITSGKALNMTGAQFNARLKNHDPNDNPFIVCVDDAGVYAKGHITQSVNMPWAQLFTQDNLSKLPTNQEIVVYSVDGHLGSQAAAMLNILGYNATDLMWGIASCTFDNTIAPIRYNESVDCMDYAYIPGTLPTVYPGYY